MSQAVSNSQHYYETTPLVCDSPYDTRLFRNAEERKRVEQTLLRKLDARMSILVLIYILNCA